MRQRRVAHLVGALLQDVLQLGNEERLGGTWCAICEAGECQEGTLTGSGGLGIPCCGAELRKKAADQQDLVGTVLLDESDDDCHRPLAVDCVRCCQLQEEFALNCTGGGEGRVRLGKVMVNCGDMHRFGGTCLNSSVVGNGMSTMR